MYIELYMRILSWNILASEWIKKSYYKDADHAMLFNRRQRFTKITELIREVDADIVMLQEVMTQEHKKFIAQFEKDYIISGLNKIVWQYKSDSKSGNVTMVKRSMFGDHDVKQHSKDYGLYTQCIHNNIHYDVFNIHLDDLSRKKRYDQMEEACNTCRSNKCVNIIAGDFNQVCRAGSKFYDIAGFMVHNKCATYYNERNMNIDNILTRGTKKQIPSKCYASPTTFDEGIKLYGSDHLPVITDIAEPM